ncbi:MAG: VTT domain-containing protein [Gammaproteobacteria bacterium]
MTIWFESLFATLLAALALPRYSLATVFMAALLGSTLLPLGSEPIVFGLIKLNPAEFWPVMAAATVGGTIGGGISWAMGFGAERAWERATQHSPRNLRALDWLQRFGPKACVLSWLPVVGDPLCAVAGWLRLPFWPCIGWMAIGKLGRYIAFTIVLLKIFPGST